MDSLLEIVLYDKITGRRSSPVLGSLRSERRGS